MSESTERFTKKAVGCPHCGELIVLSVATTLHIAETVDDATIPQDELSDGQRAALGKAKQTGVFVAWLNTFNASPQGAIGALKADRAFLRFLSQSSRRELTPTVKRFIMDEYHYDSHRDIYALTLNQVTAIAANGMLVAFYPSDIALGRTSKNLPSHKRSMPNINLMANWKKTRHGYIPDDCKFFATEMTKKSIGAFANVGV